MAFTPTDPTKAEVRVVGTYPNQTLDFYIPRGAKGEPGGIVLGTILGTADLNSFFTPGTYRQTNGADATLLRNYPKANLTGLLNIFGRDGNVVVQQYMPIDGTSGVPTMYQRLSTSPTTWTSWRVFNSTRVDQTAGRAIYGWDDLNNREQLVYGDTGNRNILADLQAKVPSFTVGYGTAVIRRHGNVVTFTPAYFSGTRPVDEILYTVPTGFRRASSANYPMVHPIMNLQGVNVAGSCLTYHIGNIYWYGPDVNSRSITPMTWMTDDPWPTTLPGVAVGTIPNV